MQVRRGSLGVRAWVAAGALGLAGTAGAVSLGQQDSFEGASTDGWSHGAASPNPPALVPSGGPSGSGDGYMVISAFGGLGAGSRLVGIGGDQWDGDYAGAGVTAIRLDAINLGATDLSLRLWVVGAAGSAFSAQGLALPVGSGWQNLRFDVTPTAFNSSNAAATLAAVSELRLIHSIDGKFPPSEVAGSLGVDNVTAVPEPGAAWLLAAGLAGLAARRRWRTPA